MKNTHSTLASKAESTLAAAAQERTPVSYEIFDNVARILGSEMPRRKAFRMVLSGLAGVALAEFGIKSAWAAANCLCLGQTYDPTTACCTASGVQPKHPLSSVSACPNKVPHPGYTATFNGCGGQGSVFNPVIPGHYGAANFTPCCNTHDICYGTCNDVKATCDSSLLTCMTASCDAAYSAPGVLNSIQRANCHGVANTFHSAVSNAGGSFYEAGQDGACDCCSTSTCPQSCAGSSCGSLPSCAGGGDCLCFSQIEGGGMCAHGSTPCAGIIHCSSTADCPAGSACSNTTCCGSFPVCVPLCNPILPSSQSSSLSSHALSATPETGVLTVGGYR